VLQFRVFLGCFDLLDSLANSGRLLKAEFLREVHFPDFKKFDGAFECRDCGFCLCAAVKKDLKDFREAFLTGSWVLSRDLIRSGLDPYIDMVLAQDADPVGLNRVGKQ
jgi:hypothetical protein